MVLAFFVPKLWFRKDLLVRARRYVRAILYTFNLQTLLLAVVSCTAVFLCEKWNFRYSMDFTLVATGSTFPLIFTIQQAFTRREKACSLIAELKASIVATYLMHRDWAQDEGFPASLGSNHTASALKAKALLLELLHDMRCYLTAHSVYESYAERRMCRGGFSQANWLVEPEEEAETAMSAGPGCLSRVAEEAAQAALVAGARRQEPASMWLRKCYRAISQLSVMNEQLGLKAGYTRGGEGGMSRTHQYLRYIIASLEELRMLREYRTPIMMRYANGVLLHVFAVILAPYFLHFCDSWVEDGFQAGTCPAGYSASLVFVVIVMLLYNIEQDMEQPFDESGLDDVFFDIGEELLDEVFDVQGTTQAGTPCAASRSGSMRMHGTRSMASLRVTTEFPTASKVGSPAVSPGDAAEWVLKTARSSSPCKGAFQSEHEHGALEQQMGHQGQAGLQQLQLVPQQAPLVPQQVVLLQQQESPVLSRLQRCSSTEALLSGVAGSSDGGGQ